MVNLSLGDLEPSTPEQGQWYLNMRKRDLERKIKNTLGSANRVPLERELEKVNRKLQSVNERLVDKENGEKV